LFILTFCHHDKGPNSIWAIGDIRRRQCHWRSIKLSYWNKEKCTSSKQHFLDLFGIHLIFMTSSQVLLSLHFECVCQVHYSIAVYCQVRTWFIFFCLIPIRASELFSHLCLKMLSSWGVQEGFKRAAARLSTRLVLLIIHQQCREIQGRRKLKWKIKWKKDKCIYH